jgi:hypothetical protein
MRLTTIRLRAGPAVRELIETVTEMVPSTS